MEINEQNIEELILLYVDGELDAKEAGELMSYIAAVPEYQELLKSYKETVTSPEPGLIFSDKASLLRPEEPKVILLKHRQWRFTIPTAAAILLMLATLAIWQLQKDNTINKPQTIARSNISPNRLAPGPFTPPSVPANTILQQKKNTAQRGIQYIKTGPGKGTNTLPENIHTPENRTTEQQPAIEPLPSQKPIRLEQRVQINTEPAAPIAMTADTDEAEENTAKLPSWLPVDKEKLEGVNDLVAQFKEVKERIEEGGRTLKNASFALRIGDKEIGFGRKNHN